MPGSNSKSIPQNETDPLLPLTSVNKASEPTGTNGQHKKRSGLFGTKGKEDAIEILSLAVPIFVAMVSWIAMKTTDTALLGHVGEKYLSASALSDLYTMCTGVLVRGSVLGILCSQAVGAGNPKLAGIYLQVSYFILFFMSLGVIIAWTFTEQVWLALGQGTEISSDAGYYAKILAVSIPGQVAFSQLTQFFSSQRIMNPEVTSSIIAVSFNLVLGLVFVMGVPALQFSGFGFAACPVVTTTVVYVQILVLWYVYCFRKGLHKNAWGGWNWRELTEERVRTFAGLYFPAALGVASDFWRMGAVGLMAAQIGEVEVGVFNTSYRIIWIVIIFSSSVASATGIKMGAQLGGADPDGAKRTAHVGILMALVMLVVLSLGMCMYIRTFGRIFTSDEHFLDLFEECRVPFVATLFLMNLAVAIEGVPISMGRTSEVFWLGFIGSWFGQVPGAYFLTKYWRYDLVGLYSGVALGYALLVILYSVLALTSDWKKYSDIAVKRSEATK